MSQVDRIELRKKVRDNHEEIWAKVKAKFNDRNFPTQKMKDETHKVRSTDSAHWQEKNKHQTTHYSLYEPMLEFFGIDWSYDYCGECREVVKQRGVLTNQIEGMAIVKDFMNQPVKMTANEVVNFFGEEVNYEKV